MPKHTIEHLNNLNFETLLATSSGDSWHPIAVLDINNIFNLDYNQDYDFSYKIGKNLSYNIQYLQFLQKQIFELRLSEVLLKMLYKNYVITSLSIIETIFAFIVKQHNLWRLRKWKEISHTSKTNKVNDSLIMTDTIQYENIPPVEDIMDFSDLIQIVRDRKLIKLSVEQWKFLMRFKKKRNRVHIRITKEVSTEYNDFSIYDYLSAKILLQLIILKNDEVINDKIEALEIFKFLKLSDDEK